MVGLWHCFTHISWFWWHMMTLVVSLRLLQSSLAQSANVGYSIHLSPKYVGCPNHLLWFMMGNSHLSSPVKTPNGFLKRGEPRLPTASPVGAHGSNTALSNSGGQQSHAQTGAQVFQGERNRRSFKHSDVQYYVLFVFDWMFLCVCAYWILLEFNGDWYAYIRF